MTVCILNGNRFISEPAALFRGKEFVNSIKMEKGSEAQLADICGLYEAAIAYMNECGLHFWDFNWYPTESVLADDVRRNELYCAVDQNSGRIAGCVVLNTVCDEQYANGSWLYTGEPHLIIHRLCLHPDFQGKGIATEVMRNVCLYAGQNGYRNIRLDAFSGNPAPLHLYGKFGFRKAGEAKWEKGTFFLMEKDLEAQVLMNRKR